MEELNSSELDALNAIQGNEDSPTETIEFGDADIEVLAHLTGELEDIISELNDLEPEKTTDYRDLVIDAITSVIVEQEEQPDFGNRAVWEAYWEKHGTVGILEAFHKLTSPALKSVEDEEIAEDGF